jgi:hypothetical protein
MFKPLQRWLGICFSIWDNCSGSRSPIKQSLRALRELCLGSLSWQQIINQSQLSENAELEWDHSGQAKKGSKNTLSLRPELRDPPVDLGSKLTVTNCPSLLNTVPVSALHPGEALSPRQTRAVGHLSWVFFSSQAAFCTVQKPCVSLCVYVGHTPLPSVFPAVTLIAGSESTGKEQMAPAVSPKG